jgi:hypothetical protein
MNKREVLIPPQQFVNLLKGRAKEILQQCYVEVTTFGCGLYGTGEPWDIGECFGYAIYCPDELMEELEQYLDYISDVGIAATKTPYKGDKRQPGCCMACRASFIFEREYKPNGLTREFNRAFLESCFHK